MGALKRHDVHAHRSLSQIAVAHDEVSRRTGDALLLATRDARRGTAETCAGSVTYLDEYDRRTVGGNQINLTESAAVLPGKNLKPCR